MSDLLRRVTRISFPCSPALAASLCLATALPFAALPSPAAAGEIRVGALSDLTGAYSHVGALMADAKDLAAADVNAQGGLLATGETYTLVRGDSRCNADDGLAAGRAVFESGIVAMLGATCSGATIAMAENVAIPNGLMVISPSATAPVISGMKDNDLVFRMSPSDLFLSEALSAMVLDRGIKRAAVTWADDAYNKGVGDAFLAEFRAHGGIVTAEAEHVAGSTDYAALVGQLATGETDVLIVFAYYDASGADVINAALAEGSFKIFFGADGMINDGLVTQVGAENLGWSLFMIAAADRRTAGYKRFTKIAEAAGLDPATPFLAQSYDAAFLAALAIEKAGSTDPAAIRDALRDVANAPGARVLPGEWAEAKALIAAGEDINYFGASGQVEFDAAGDTPGRFSVDTVKPDGSWDVFVLR